MKTEAQRQAIIQKAADRLRLFLPENPTREQYRHALFSVANSWALNAGLSYGSMIAELSRRVKV